MRVLLHIGPHKTGSSSLQFFLAGRYGSAAPQSIWYPPADRPGPGHAALAADLWAGGTALAACAAQARAAGVELLLISSETFDKFVSDDSLARLRAAFAGDELILMMALNAPARRVISAWQEQVKHGWAEPLTASRAALLSRPDLHPDYAARLIRGLAPAETHVLLASRGDPPTALLGRACAALGLPPPQGEEGVVARNPSLGWHEAEMLLHFNQITRAAGAGPGQWRAKRMRMALTLRKIAQDMPGPPLALPPGWWPELEQGGAATAAALTALVAAGRLTLHGALSALADPPAGAG